MLLKYGGHAKLVTEWWEVWNGMELCFYSKLWKKMVLVNFKAGCLKWEIKIDNKANKVELSPIEVISRLKKIAKICVCVFCYNIFLCSSIISKKYLSMLEKLEREKGIISECWLGKKGGYIYITFRNNIYIYIYKWNVFLPLLIFCNRQCLFSAKGDNNLNHKMFISENKNL